jgi:hypothetical protein
MVARTLGAATDAARFDAQATAALEVSLAASPVDLPHP